MQDQWRFLGEVRAVSRAGLASGVSGTVTKLRAREGDRVKKGQLLVEVDSALAIARVGVALAEEAQIKETVDQAKRELERLAGLEKDVVPEVELERAGSRVHGLAAQLRAKEAATQEARAQLALHRVTAPFPGVVASRQVDLGDWVRPGDPVLELVSTEHVEILVDASQDLFRRVKPGDEATLIGPTNSKAEVAGVVPALNRTTRTVRVRLVPKDEATSLIPGSAVNVEFAVDLSDEGVVVPQDALLAGATSAKIVKIVEGKAKPLQVQILAKAEEDALVRADGLVVGDLVVTRGNERLRPDQPVKIAE
jgi:RND family efflux transporter MFP subunit